MLFSVEKEYRKMMTGVLKMVGINTEGGEEG